uniref:DUF1488 domain-containing protein n=1 Tax=Providencia stuartii TaxID=588 RepID=A0AAI9GHP1_PROST|nr:DUF1488 domain-containing protein [Providencia stuartii]
MNQAIQFPDREEWGDTAKVVRFPVMVNGMLAECVISDALLYRRYGHNAQPISLFQNNRWDIEEEFEALIAQGHGVDSVYSLPEER